MKDERNLQPWQYPEEQWRKIVNRVNRLVNARGLRNRLGI